MAKPVLNNLLKLLVKINNSTVDATKARDRMNPLSSKVTKFSNKSSRDFQKIPLVSLSLAFVTTTVRSVQKLGIFLCPSLL